MAKSYAQLQQEIAELQAKAQAARAKEAQSVIAGIRKTILQYGLTADDLFGRSRVAAKKRSRTASAKKVSPVKGKSIPVKYQDPAGNTWTGRGSRPRWLVAALADGTKSLEDFAV